MFSTLPKPNFSLSVTYILLPANALNLDQSNTLLYGRILTLYKTKIFDQSKLKAFLDNTVNVVQVMIFVSGKLENTVGKGENGGHRYSF